MVDYLLTGGIIFLFLAGGASCIVWPRRMRWAKRNVIPSPLSEGQRDRLTQVVGAAFILLTLTVTFFVIKNSV